MKKIYLVLTTLLGIHLFLLIHLSFTPWPEMLSYPYLFSHGYTLYKDFIVPYPPFLVLLLSFVYKVFGYKVVVLKTFTWLLILLSDVSVFLTVKKTVDSERWAVIGVLFFVIIQPFLQGNMLWVDTFLVLPVLLGIYFLLKSRLFLCGLFFAMAVFSKQTAVVYLLIAGGFTLYKYKKLEKVWLLFLPSFIFAVLFLLYLLLTKSLTNFFDWNLFFPAAYWSKYPGYVKFTLGNIDRLILAGLLAAAAVAFKRSKLIFWMSLGSLLAVYPRFSYYHLAVGISLFAVCFSILLKHYYKVKPVIFAILVFLFVFFWYRGRSVLAWDWGKQDRFYDIADAQVVEDIDSNFGLNANVYLANIHSGVYVYAQALPPKPWYDNYGWYWEVPGKQKDVIKLWEQNPPEAIYWKDELAGNQYLPGVYRPKEIYSWVNSNYTKEKEVVNGIWRWRKK